MRAINTRARVREGADSELLATGLENTRLFRVSPSGDLFIAESRPGRIRVLRAPQRGGKSEIRIFAEDLDQPFGIAFWPPNRDGGNRGCDHQAADRRFRPEYLPRPLSERKPRLLGPALGAARLQRADLARPRRVSGELLLAFSRAAQELGAIAVILR